MVMIKNKYVVDYEVATGLPFVFWRYCWLHLRSYLFWGRLYESSSDGFVKRIAGFVVRQMAKRNGNEISFNGNIGSGLVLAHGRNITVNSRSVIGSRCVLFKGCTIGSVRSGKREGVPCIGNRVVIGCNAFVCGGITIGDDVLIAANAFVNFDVPSNSVVVGNPGVVHRKDNPCNDYIN